MLENAFGDFGILQALRNARAQTIRVDKFPANTAEWTAAFAPYETKMRMIIAACKKTISLEGQKA
jgi:hypothetical protein